MRSRQAVDNFVGKLRAAGSQAVRSRDLHRAASCNTEKFINQINVLTLFRAIRPA
jgi:hypothetical protein